MSGEDRIRMEIEKTLKLLGTEEQLKTDAYFFTRLEAKIRAGNARQPHAGREAGRWRPLVLAALAGVNIAIAALWTFSANETQQKEAAMTYLAWDYGLTADAGDWLDSTIGE